MLTILAFVVALGLLIAIHEYGHYRVAVACGVKVLKFSVGFGREIYRFKPKRQRAGQDTEFVIGMLPLGGFVKMLDEREAPVPAHELHLAFNRQPLRSRAAIVAAGPLANLALAVLLYAVVNWMGVNEPRAVISSPLAGSVAQQAGLSSADEVLQAAFDGDALEPVRSYDGLQWVLTRAALEGRDVRLLVKSARGTEEERVVALSGLDTREADARLLRQIGLVGPWSRPVMGDVMPDSPAARAGLRAGDLVLRVGDTAVVDGPQLRELIRRSVRGDKAQPSDWQVLRQGERLTLRVEPELRQESAGQVIGRVGALIGEPPELVNIRYGPLEGLWRGMERTWEVSSLTLGMMGKMLVGEASLKNLSGPITIADFAGKSASLGLTQYLVFLALISVSLGVLNLLPLPVLDGGHLMYYLWEGVTGRPVSEAWLERLQRGGVAVLLAMMSIAVFNDVSRLLG